MSMKKLAIGAAAGYVVGAYFFGTKPAATATNPNPSVDWSPNSTNLIGAGVGAAAAHFLWKG